MAAEALADAHARQGRAADDVALLEDLAARDPLRESVAVQLVRALYAAGRQADALAAYDRCCGALADELGVEPTPALRRVRAAVLAHDPLPGVGGTVLPTHLPPRNRSFVGRRGLLAHVDATLDDDTRRPRAVALTGLGGVGQDRARAGAGPPAAPARPGRLVDLRRRPRRHRHRARRAGRGAGDRAVRAARGRPRGAVGRAGPHTGLAARLRQRGRARAARAVPARGARTATSSSPPATRRGGASPTPSRSGRWPVASRWPTSPPAPGTGPSRRTRWPSCSATSRWRSSRRAPTSSRHGCRCPTTSSLFRRHRDGLLLREVEGSGRTVATTWGLAFDRLAVRAPRAAELLETIAFLAPDAISVGTLGRFEPGELELQDALRELLRLSLVDREADTVRVHRLVQDVVRARMSEAARRDRLAVVAHACVAQAIGVHEAGARRPGRRRRAPRRPRAARRGARRAAGRAGRGPRAGGRPAGAAGALPGCRARAARGAAAAGRQRSPRPSVAA